MSARPRRRTRPQRLVGFLAAVAAAAGISFAIGAFAGGDRPRLPPNAVALGPPDTTTEVAGEQATALPAAPPPTTAAAPPTEVTGRPATTTTDTGSTDTGTTDTGTTATGTGAQSAPLPGTSA
ncbi:MAG: hypothetical protein ACRDZV_06395, partial [Acidimicrobiia bacterium]